MRFALFAVALTSVAFVASGVPLLRHDWFPIVPGLRFAVDNVTGWDPTGLGAVVGYPASFLLVFVRSAVAAVAGSYATHLLFFASYALLVVFGAERLVRVLGGPPVAGVAAALFAAFNPWAYDQLVAGHGFMLLSYAATLWLVAECCSPVRSPLRLALLTIPIAPQVQFLIVDAFVYFWLAWRMRSWITLFSIASMLLPVGVGVVVSRGVLLGIPLTLEWERDQSLDPLRAVFLRGYFTGYDSILPVFVEWSLWIVIGIAFIGVVAILLYQRRRAWLIVVTAVPLVWSFGLRGPFFKEFTWVITHISEAGLFRELYDLIGYVTIGYVAFCAIAVSRYPKLGGLWFGAAIAMCLAWVIAPPQRYWVTRQELPVSQVGAVPNTRFLLTPALYPMRFSTRGSGIDYDLYPRADNVTPVNEALPMYPYSAALGRYMRDGSLDALGALSVERVVVRPWLATDPSIRYQLALPVPDWLRRSPGRAMSVARTLPELTLGPLPDVGTLVSNVGAGNVLFGDAREATGSAIPTAWRAFEPVRPVTPGDVFVRASDGWVDARLAFVEYPELAQAYGGALTTNRNATLRVTAGMATLVYVRGRLSSLEGLTVASDAPGYAWVNVPNDVNAVRCSGLCVVAAQTSHVPEAPLDPPAHIAAGVIFNAPVPWFITAKLPASAASLLRYNSTYDKKWTAYFAGSSLPHLRIDGAVNGWLVPRHAQATSVTLLETGAAITCFSELAAVTVLGIVIYKGSRRLGTAPEARVSTMETARAVQIASTASSDRTM